VDPAASSMAAITNATANTQRMGRLMEDIKPPL
jgi:hypothetical protein